MGEQKGPRPGFQRYASYTEQGRYSDCVFEIDGRFVPTRGFVDEVATRHALRFLEERRDGPFLAWVGLKSPHGPRFRNNPHKGEYAGVPVRELANAGAHPPFPLQDEWDALAKNAGEELSRPAETGGASWRRRAQTVLMEDRPATTTTGSSRRRARGCFRGLDDSGSPRTRSSLRRRRLPRGRARIVGKRVRESMRSRCSCAPLVPRSHAEQLVLNVDLADDAGAPIPAACAALAAPAARRSAGSLARGLLFENTASSTSLPDRSRCHARGEKLVLYDERPEWTELFDLATDPGETVNLARDPAHAADVERLRARLEQLDRELGPRPKRVRAK
jgi:hypothetical protein